MPCDNARKEDCATLIHMAHDMCELKGKHRNQLEFINTLAKDALDALEILDTNPDALKVAIARINAIISKSKV